MCEQMISRFHIIPTKPRRNPRHGLFGRVVPIAGMLFLWRDRTQQRHDLAQLDDRQIADIGLTREQVEAECAKAFWQT